MPRWRWLSAVLGAVLCLAVLASVPARQLGRTATAAPSGRGANYVYDGETENASARAVVASVGAPTDAQSEVRARPSPRTLPRYPASAVAANTANIDTTALEQVLLSQNVEAFAGAPVIVTDATVRLRRA